MDTAKPSDTKRGKYPRLTTPSQSVPERRASLRGRPKTADMPWAAYKRLPELDKGKDKQNIDGRGYRFRVTNRPTTYRDNNGEPENIGDYSSYKEARDFIQHHLSTLDDDDGLILTQKVDLIPEGGDNQTLLRVIGPDWDITIVAHYIWDEAIYLSSQPDAIEVSRWAFNSNQEELADCPKRHKDAQAQTHTSVGVSRIPECGILLLQSQQYRQARQLLILLY